MITKKAEGKHMVMVWDGRSNLGDRNTEANKCKNTSKIIKVCAGDESEQLS